MANKLPTKSAKKLKNDLQPYQQIQLRAATACKYDYLALSNKIFKIIYQKMKSLKIKKSSLFEAKNW